MTGAEPVFSPAVRAGDLLFVSGQASVDAHGTIVPGSFAEQMHRSVENVRRILAEHGLDLSDVVRVGGYVVAYAPGPATAPPAAPPGP